MARKLIYQIPENQDIFTIHNHILNQPGTAYLLGGPLEAGDDAVLDLVKVLDSLGAVNHQVGSVGVGAEAPNLPAILRSDLLSDIS